MENKTQSFGDLDTVHQYYNKKWHFGKFLESGTTEQHADSKTQQKREWNESGEKNMTQGGKRHQQH